MPPSDCDEEEWSKFFNIDGPSDGCDCEDFSTLRQQYPELCSRPSAMEVRLADGEDIFGVNQIVHRSLTEGFQCYNEDQEDGKTCSDYKVRYCCPRGKSCCFFGCTKVSK